MSHSETLQGLDSASQKHESEIVVDLAPDRILHFLGVYVIVLLAVATKITEFAGQGRLSCFPINQSKSDLTFINHANKYCWESSETELVEVEKQPNISACQKFKEANEADFSRFHANSLVTKRFLQWMPYAMLLEAFLFALPSVFWHFTVGARLMGHLKFMQLLLQDVYESVKKLPAGIYTKEPYDKEGLSLNCWRKYTNINPNASNRPRSGEEESGAENEAHQSTSPQTSKAAVSGDDNSTDDTNATHDASEDQGSTHSTATLSEKKKLLCIQTKKHYGKKTEKKIKHENTELKTLGKATKMAGSREDVSKEDTGTSHASEQEKSETSQSRPRHHNLEDVLKIITKPEFGKVQESSGRKSVDNQGQLSDRHIFSMLCYENFASLQHHPYLKSVQQLTSAPPYDNTIEGAENEEVILPMKHAILRKFCDKHNFESRFVVKAYFLKCTISLVLSSLIFGGFSLLFASVILPTIWKSSFICEIPYQEQCLSCTLTGLIDVYAGFFANWVAVTIYLIVASVKTDFVRNASDHALSHFLEDTKSLCSVALVAAHQIGEDKA